MSTTTTTTDNKEARTFRPVTDIAKDDHRVVEGLFKMMETATTADVRRAIAMMTVRELSVHSALEEEILYPMYKDPKVSNMGTKGEQFYEHSIAEHRTVKQLLYQLDQTDCDPNDKEFTVRWNAVVKDIQQHVKEEETELFPAFEKACGLSVLLDLGKKWVDNKAYMPTRPHPDAKPGNYLGDRALFMADSARDLTRFGTDGADVWFAKTTGTAVPNKCVDKAVCNTLNKTCTDATTGTVKGGSGPTMSTMPVASTTATR